MATTITIEIDDEGTERRMRQTSAQWINAMMCNHLNIKCRKVTINSIDEENTRLMAMGEEFEAYGNVWTRKDLNESIGEITKGTTDEG